MRALLALSAAAALLAACNQSGEEGQLLEEANASGEAASETLENRVEQSDAPPLAREQALALIEQRHDNYERIGDAMRTITRELRTGSPNFGQLRQNSATIAELAPQVQDWFPQGTGPDVGETEARVEIWQNPEDFAQRARNFNQAAQQFDRVAQTDDLDAIRAAHRELGATCKACHDTYREEN